MDLDVMDRHRTLVKSTTQFNLKLPQGDEGREM